MALFGTPGPDTSQGSSSDETYFGLGSNDHLWGAGGQDQLVGGDGDDDINGDTGNDTLIGDAGADYLHGGAGDDHLEGGAGFDHAAYYGATGSVSVDLSIVGPQAVGGGSGLDLLLGIEGLSGSPYNDTLLGDGAGNNLAGMAGNDYLDGRGGFDNADYYTATGGVTVNLSIVGPQAVGGGHGVDTLVSIENILGSFYGDTLTGNAGDNWFNTRGGGDRVDGGAGFDFVDFRDLSGGVVANLGGSAPQALSVDGADTLIGIEGLVGTNFNDTLVGDAGANAFAGRQGDDLINGGAGDDSVDYVDATGGVMVNLNLAGPQAVGGGHGVDTLLSIEHIWGSIYGDTLTGTSGNNYFTTRGGGDWVDGGAGFDTVDFRDHSGGVVASLAAPAPQAISVNGADTLIGIEALRGSAFNDTLVGDAAFNTLVGAAGDDSLDGGAGIDTVDFYDAVTGVAVNLSNGGLQLISATEGSDVLIGFENILGSFLNDTLTGDAAANTLTGRAGDDVLAGGAGLDTASYFEANAGVAVSLSIVGPQAVGADQGVDTLIEIEGLLGSRFNDTLTGDSASNSFNDGAGDDSVSGLGGDDSFFVGAGNDTIDGGDGEEDIILLSAASAGVHVDLGVFTAQAIGGGLGTDGFINIESVFGSNFGDTLSGNALGNYLGGGGGEDSLAAAAGDDVLAGGAGNDLLDGGASSPVHGQRNWVGGDLATYEDASGSVSVNLSLVGPQAVGGGRGIDTIINIENLLGSAFGDSLTGDAGDNYIGGQLGADTIVGLGGDDILEGGVGDDRLDGGDGVDLASYYGATSAVRVDLSLSGAQAVGGGGGVDTLVSIERIYGSVYSDTLIGNTQDNRLDGQLGDDSLGGGAGADCLLGADGQDTLNGGVGHDHLEGEAGADSLLGGDGNDTLAGGGENDVLTGGRGADVFVFGPGSGSDTVTDFRPGEDDISFVATAFSSFADVLAHATQVGSHVIVAESGLGALQLNNVLLANLQSSDFIFA